MFKSEIFQVIIQTFQSQIKNSQTQNQKRKFKIIQEREAKGLT